MVDRSEFNFAYYSWYITSRFIEFYSVSSTFSTPYMVPPDTPNDLSFFFYFFLFYQFSLSLPPKTRFLMFFVENTRFLSFSEALRASQSLSEPLRATARQQQTTNNNNNPPSPTSPPSYHAPRGQHNPFPPSL